MKIALEIRPGEGGKDAKLLVEDHARLYLRYAELVGLQADVSTAEGWLTVVLEGEEGRIALLLRESGGHRYQRVPPTERKGRVHTSTVTVVALELKDKADWKLKDADILIFTTKDGGPGGQHRNKTESCVIMRHLPTGIEAKASAKSQHRNRAEAREVLEARVAAHFRRQASESLASERRDKAGSGMRGDKIRTYREQDDVVIDHLSGLKHSLKRVRQGRLWA